MHERRLIAGQAPPARLAWLISCMCPVMRARGCFCVDGSQRKSVKSSLPAHKLEAWQCAQCAAHWVDMQRAAKSCSEAVVLTQQTRRKQAPADARRTCDQALGSPATCRVIPLLGCCLGRLWVCWSGAGVVKRACAQCIVCTRQQMGKQAKFSFSFIYMAG